MYSVCTENTMPCSCHTLTVVTHLRQHPVHSGEHSCYNGSSRDRREHQPQAVQWPLMVTAMECEMQCDPPVAGGLNMEQKSMDAVLSELPQDSAKKK